MAANSAEGVRWNLTDLFSSHDDPRIDQTLSDCRDRAEAFSRQFRDRLENPAGLTPQQLLDGLQELERIYEALSRVGCYSGLLYAADTARPEYQDLEQKVEQRSTEIRNLLLFFELEWLKVEDAVAERLIDDPALKAYSHYLRSLRRFRPHTLTEPEEKILNEKDNTGRNAFGRLFSELTSSLTFALEKDDKKEDLNLSEILSLLHEPDRKLRQRAMDTLYAGLAPHGQVLTFVYDTLLQDHLTMDRLRHYLNPIAQRHLFNEIDGAAVDTMMQVVESNYGIGRDYFRLKAKLLGLPRLALYDQYAPLGKENRPFPYDQAREVILAALGAFTPRFGEIAWEFFANNWIDAEIRKGKRGGAFCSSPSPQLHPYILCNYTDNLRDVMTVAHELGHGLHGCLSRKQSYFNYDTPLTTAETASVFGEMLVFDYLLARQTDPRVQIDLLAGKLEDIFATVFRQNVLTRFEAAAFAARQERRLTPELLGTLWLKANSKYYGDAVEMPEGYRWGWSYIPHFIHSRFYCYSYVFGQLLVLALYRMYREQGQNFVPKYLALLEAGGSDSPEALLKPLDVNIHDPGFWQKGFQEISELVKRLEGLVAET
ncbi:MAG TPA: M3 family oligoendopeptidase [Candidatus Binatia bacterium]|nr:M3 family oligoendopeptidase [Candidatus Binatia bacterium]